MSHLEPEHAAAPPMRDDAGAPEDDGSPGSVPPEFPASEALWPGDAGTLPDRSRRALLELVRGPYLSLSRSPQNWSALLADQQAIRSRLNDMFLELVLDADAELAFVRAVGTETDDFPRAVRSEALTFLDTAMVLALRQRLIVEDTGGRVIIGQDELYEELEVYRTADRDQADFTKRLNSSWNKMVNKLRILHPTGGDTGEGTTRAEISPVVRMIVDADRVAALRGAYEQIAQDNPSAQGSAGSEGEPASSVQPASSLNEDEEGST